MPPKLFVPEWYPSRTSPYVDEEFAVFRRDEKYYVSDKERERRRTVRDTWESLARYIFALGDAVGAPHPQSVYGLLGGNALALSMPINPFWIFGTGAISREDALHIVQNKAYPTGNDLKSVVPARKIEGGGEDWSAWQMHDAYMRQLLRATFGIREPDLQRDDPAWQGIEEQKRWAQREGLSYIVLES